MGERRTRTLPGTAVVVVVLGGGLCLLTLALIVLVGTPWGVTVTGLTDKAKVADVKADFRRIEKMLVDYEGRTAVFPPSLQVLFSGGQKSLEVGIDPWTREYYIYQRVGNDFLVKSLGADQKPGGEGVDSDLIIRGRP